MCLIIPDNTAFENFTAPPPGSDYSTLSVTHPAPSQIQYQPQGNYNVPSRVDTPLQTETLQMSYPAPSDSSGGGGFAPSQSQDQPPVSSSAAIAAEPSLSSATSAANPHVEAVSEGGKGSGDTQVTDQQPKNAENGEVSVNEDISCIPTYTHLSSCEYCSERVVTHPPKASFILYK